MKTNKLLISILIFLSLILLNACNNETGKNTSVKDHVATVTAPSANQQTYIKDIKAVGAYWDKYAYNGTGTLKNKYGDEYSRLSNWNLNCDCGTTTDCIYLYESRTIYKEEAITDIIAVTQKNVPKNFVYNDHNYEVVGGVRINGLNSSKTEYERFDLNMNAGGDYIYLCVSHDQDFGKPITKFTVGGSSSFDSNKSNNYILDMTNKGEYQNFNAGAGGTTIYGAVSCAITGWIINEITLIDKDKDFNEIEKVVVLNTENKSLTENDLKPIIDKGEGAHFLGYYSKKALEEGELITTSTVIPYDYTIWARWTYDITIDYTALGGGIESYTNVSKFPYNNDYPLYYLVFQETGKKANGLCWPGAYIAVEY